MRGEVTCQSILALRVNEADVFRTSLKLNQWDVAGGGGGNIICLCSVCFPALFPLFASLPIFPTPPMFGLVFIPYTGLSVFCVQIPGGKL